MSLLTRALSEKGRAYHYSGKYNQAIVYYLQLDSLATHTKNIDYQIISNYNIAIIKMTLGNYEDAASLFLKNKGILKPLAKEKKICQKIFKYTNRFMYII